MMMFDFNPWTSLFFLQSIRMSKQPTDARARRREQIAAMNRQAVTAAADAPAAARVKLPPPRQKPRPPRRGWRDAFRTEPARGEAEAVKSRNAA